MFQRSPRFPKAQYYCRLCDYHCDTLNICISHIKDLRHSRLARMQDIETTLFHLPKPHRHHLDVIEQLLDTVAMEHGLAPYEIKAREEVAASVDAFLKTVIKGACFPGFLYGTHLVTELFP